MSEQASPPGFGRLIAAVKGVGQFLDWLARPSDAPAVKGVLPAHGVHCPELPPTGYRCVLRVPHAQCVIEKVQP